MRAAAVVAFCVGTMLPLSAHALDHTQLAVIVNTLDPLSVAIGDYYASRRKIPSRNLIQVEFPPGSTALSRETFEAVKARIDKLTPPRVQAYALTWAAPYRVECMSITTAIAFGFVPGFCANGCGPTQPSPYFDSSSLLPFTKLGMRPTMAIAAATIGQARALIDRGVKSDGSFPVGTAYLLSTGDRERNVRLPQYAHAEQLIRSRGLYGRTMKQDTVKFANDVMFYFTGAIVVSGMETLRFLPGAVADHLTSSGGMLTDSSQMSAMRWLEAGATGSYGTVVEPCNFTEKFPKLSIVVDRYLRGDTLIEAYWKSVLMPGQGIFIGEPLAAPFRSAATR